MKNSKAKNVAFYGIMIALAFILSYLESFIPINAIIPIPGVKLGFANPVGAAVVGGVQGRYFIILIILPFIALVSDKIKHNINHFTIKVSAIMGIMLLYALFILIKTCY